MGDVQYKYPVVIPIKRTCLPIILHACQIKLGLGFRPRSSSSSLHAMCPFADRSPILNGYKSKCSPTSTSILIIHSNPGTIAFLQMFDACGDEEGPLWLICTMKSTLVNRIDLSSVITYSANVTAIL